jgi:uncharacterized protein HemX
MKPRTAKETAIICAAAVAVVVILTIPFELPYKDANGATTNHSVALVWIAAAGVIALGMVLGYRYRTSRKQGQLELAGNEQYRKLAEEYRRLADMAITAQEHTDLRLTDLGVQMDDLREKLDQMQRILKEVE